MRGWRVRCGGAVALAAGLSACGSGAADNAGEPHASFPVAVAAAAFPPSQRLAERTDLVITVRNAGTRPIPDVAVTLLNPRYGTAAQALGTLIAPSAQGAPALASRSRPVWVIDRAPGPCGSSCRQGGAGAAATAASDTWALGRLAPGRSARFDWHVTAIRAGRYTVDYQVAADPNGGSARAIGAGGGRVSGSFRVTISSRPPVPFVTSSGRVVDRPG